MNSTTRMSTVSFITIAELGITIIILFNNNNDKNNNNIHLFRQVLCNNNTF